MNNKDIVEQGISIALQGLAMHVKDNKFQGPVKMVRGDSNRARFCVWLNNEFGNTVQRVEDIVLPRLQKQFGSARCLGGGIGSFAEFEISIL